MENPEDPSSILGTSTEGCSQMNIPCVHETPPRTTPAGFRAVRVPAEADEHALRRQLPQVAVASRRVVGIEHAILGDDQSEGVSSLTDAWSLSTTA